MRFLLDEHFPDETVLILRGLTHEAEHVRTLGLDGVRDEVAARRARDFDVLMTLDLHRQEAEWIAVNREILRHGIKVLRLRLYRQPQKGEIHLLVARHLVWRMEEWLLAFEGGAGLVTVGPAITRVSIRNPEEVAAMLKGRGVPEDA